MGFVLAALSSHSYWAVVGMAVAAVGMALINSIGNLGGYLGPIVVGKIKDTTGHFEWALYFMAACLAVSTVIAYLAMRSTDDGTLAPAKK